MELIYCLLAFIAGACAPTQAGINSQLRLWTGDPVLAAMISFAVGTLALLAYSALLRIPWPDLGTAGEVPWWLWAGGLLGAFLVAVTVVLVPHLGAATLMAFMIAGQLFTSLILDNYGLVGFEVRQLTLWRIVGTLLLVAGVILIKKF